MDRQRLHSCKLVHRHLLQGPVLFNLIRLDNRIINLVRRLYRRLADYVIALELVIVFLASAQVRHASPRDLAGRNRFFLVENGVGHW